MSPTLEEAMRMAERSKEMGEVAKLKDDEQPEQLGLFEGDPVNAYKASIASAGFMTIGHELKKNARVEIVGEGRVSKVTFFDQANGVSIRQHVIVIDQELTTITPL